MEPSNVRSVDLTGLDDVELVRMARQRDGAAFRVIMQRSNRRLYRIARAVVHDDSEAEDVVQEAYVRAFTSLADFRGDSSLSTWLSRIVLNEALGRLRRRRPTIDVTSIENRQPAQSTVIPFPLASTQPDPERTMAQRQIQILLERAIDDLPDDFRTVLVARVVEGMSVEETADLFGLRPETVKTRLHRARRMLRDALEKQAGPVLTNAFPFDGWRCERTTNKVLEQLGLAV
ncbi:MAG TPA: RNA polymerase sigma factor [Xanthobacteraceae bacterium]|nr:RNA polymerase sigma factor [Xanthobacteraceae bacterium]